MYSSIVMAEFQVPQFIEEKPKIVGPLTISQFLYLAAAGGVSILGFYILTFTLWLFLSIIVVGAAFALAFVKVNGEDLPAVLLSGFSFIWRPRRYTWQRAMEQTTLDIADLEKIQTLRKNISIQDKIKSLAQSITTGSILRSKPTTSERYQAVTYLTGERKVAKRVDY